MDSERTLTSYVIEKQHIYKQHLIFLVLNELVHASPQNNLVVGLVVCSCVIHT